MRHILLLPTAVLAGALALGCGEQQSPTAPSGASTAALRAAASASGTDAVVVRDAVPFGFFIFVEDPDLTTIIGLTAADLATFCVSGELPELVDVLVVERPTEAVKLLFKDKNIPVTVWPVATDDLCGLLLATPALAEGTAQFVGPNNGTTTFGLRAQGTVTNLETGEQLTYLAHIQAVATPGGELRFPSGDIRLH